MLYVHADCSFVPEKRSRKLRRPRSHAESVVEKYEEILHALKTPTSTKAGLVEGLRREEQETHLLQPVRSSVEVLHFSKILVVI